jgi:hypothetical protein
VLASLSDPSRLPRRGMVGGVGAHP